MHDAVRDHNTNITKINIEARLHHCMQATEAMCPSVL